MLRFILFHNTANKRKHKYEGSNKTEFLLLKETRNYQLQMTHAYLNKPCCFLYVNNIFVLARSAYCCCFCTDKDNLLTYISSYIVKS